MTDFTAFPKVPRLNREIIVTEKIDGTNAAVVIVPWSELSFIETNGERTLFDNDAAKALVYFDDVVVFAQSRTRFVTPENDNYGFAAWVARNAATLVQDLGEGIHFGEWWGSGIQRKYGLTGGARLFSLFNTSRWDAAEFVTPELRVVPVLYKGDFSQQAIDWAIAELRTYGSTAKREFAKPEGIVIYHTASREMFKVTLEGDEKPKGPEGHKGDEEQK